MLRPIFVLKSFFKSSVTNKQQGETRHQITHIWVATQKSRGSLFWSLVSVGLRTFCLKTLRNITTRKERELKEIQGLTTNVYLPVLYLLAFTVGLPPSSLALWDLLWQTSLGRAPDHRLLWCITWGETAEDLLYYLVHSLLLVSLCFHGVLSRFHSADTARATG